MIDPAKTAQTIYNIGASGAWYSEGIGKYWPVEKKEKMAELLFSKSFDAAGNPLGIGLSCWRFNIGGGTAEQGDSSGIRNQLRRVESFLSADGNYHLEKQSGYMWFVREAKKYGVENLIAFCNTAPVQMNKNGLGFKLEKNFITNLREDRYSAYADFLATVIEHFDKEGIHFNYISPVNEPQWDWSNKFGQMNQEGSPWVNKDIYRIIVALDSALLSKKLKTGILFPEAATLTALYNGSGHADKQVQQFFDEKSPYYTGRLTSAFPVAAGHSYFTDHGDSAIVNVRSRLRDTVMKYKANFWQSEYCMLGDGYKEGRKGKIPAIDCALFLAKIIHFDLTVANASAWQFWNAWEPGNSAFDVRYNLIALKINSDNTAGDFIATKNLWALGQYSRFVRPGMKRFITNRSDGLDDIQSSQDIMLSAFGNDEEFVFVIVNYAEKEKEVRVQIPGVKNIKYRKQYLTDVNNNMQKCSPSSLEKVKLPSRSVTTIVLGRKKKRN
ncbi:MAG: glycoside hydrolase [Lacibacter sp.]